MVKKLAVGLIVLAALIEGIAPGMVLPDYDILPLALVLLGLAYAAVAIDPEDATDYLAVVIAVYVTDETDVLYIIPSIGMQLDGIIDNIGLALYAGVVVVVARRAINRLTG